MISFWKKSFIVSIGIIGIISIALAQNWEWHNYLPGRNNSYSKFIASPLDSNVTVLGRWAWGRCEAVDIVGNYAYLGNGPTFQILDISDPANPKVLGEVFTGGLIRDMVVSGDYAYTVTPFSVIDIRNPLAPQILYSQFIGAGAQVITLDSRYVYIGDFVGIIYIVDVSDPSNPQQLGYMVAAGEQTTEIVVKEPYLYATTMDGLQVDVFDIANKNSPLHVGEYFFGGYALSLARKDFYLFLGAQNNPLLEVLDISNPVFPQPVGGISLSTAPYNLSIRDTFLFASLFDQGVAMVDISGVPNLQQVAYTPWIKMPGLGPIKHAAQSGFIHLASYLGLWTVDYQNLDSLKTVSFFPTSFETGRIAVQYPLTYLASGYAGLRIVDISDPYNPKLTGLFETMSRAVDIAVDQDKAYLLTDNDLIVLDVSDPSLPEEMGRVAFLDTATIILDRSMVVTDSFAYVARPGKKLTIIDIQDPLHPQILYTEPTLYHSFGIVLSENYLYSVEVDSGIVVYDVSQPLNPPLKLTSFNIIPSIGINKHEDLLNVAVGGGLTILDITDPLSPIPRGHINTPGPRSKVELTSTNGFVYMAYMGNLEIIDISNPDTPEIAGYFRNSTANGVAAVNNLILIGNGYFGLILLQNDLFTSITRNDTRNMNSLSLHQNYPNPFNSTAIIRYEISFRTYLRITVFNSLGQKVANLVEGVQKPGQHEIVLDGKNLSSGLYFIVLRAGNNQLVRKALLLR